MKELKKRLQDISHISSILAILYWDQEVYMPKKGADRRASSIAELNGIIHNKFLAIDSDGLLTKLKKDLDSKKIKGKDAVIVDEVWRNFERERKLPEEFVRELAETVSKSQGVWANARE